MSFQDMPPPGGFASINIQRTMPKPIIRQGIWAAIILGMTVNGLYLAREHRKRARVLKIEQMEHYIAVRPFMAAEQERKFLKHLYNLREEERELMKDVPGWKMGTFYGEPVFKTLPKGQLPPIHPVEYIAHRSDDEWTFNVIVPDLHQ